MMCANYFRAEICQKEVTSPIGRSDTEVVSLLPRPALPTLPYQLIFIGELATMSLLQQGSKVTRGWQRQANRRQKPTPSTVRSEVVEVEGSGSNGLGSPWRLGTQDTGGQSGQQQPTAHQLVFAALRNPGQGLSDVDSYKSWRRWYKSTVHSQLSSVIPQKCYRDTQH